MSILSNAFTVKGMREIDGGFFCVSQSQSERIRDSNGRQRLPSLKGSVHGITRNIRPLYSFRATLSKDNRWIVSSYEYDVGRGFVLAKCDTLDEAIQKLEQARKDYKNITGVKTYIARAVPQTYQDSVGIPLWQAKVLRVLHSRFGFGD